MNMHGIIEPAELLEPAGRAPAWRRLIAWFKHKRMFTIIVVLPTVILAAYLFLMASDQYESEADFLVRTADATPMPGIGVSQALSSFTGVSSGQNEAMSVSDYLTSHDVVGTLRENDALVQRFTRPGIDLFSRLWGSNPTPERLLNYYQRQVKVQYNTDTGITTLRVHSFTPGDSYNLVSKLLELGERRVNEMNARSFHDAIALSERQLTGAEEALTVNQAAMTNFRHIHRDIDPSALGQAQIGLVSTLTANLAAARAQLDAMGQAISHSSPQYRALQQRVAALSAQVADQSGRLTGSAGAIANDIGGYEALKLRQDFLAKRYDAAAASLQRARENAEKQQLYVVRVVEPNMPVKSLYPQRWRILITVVVALLLAYSIGWLIAAGVREHAA